MRRQRTITIGTHYAPGRVLCAVCRRRYTALGTCPDCQRDYYARERAAGRLDPITPTQAVNTRCPKGFIS